MATIKEWEENFDSLTEKRKEKVMLALQTLLSWDFFRKEFADIDRLESNLLYHEKYRKEDK